MSRESFPHLLLHCNTLYLTELDGVNTEYQEQSSHTEKTMFVLCWNIHTLVTHGRAILMDTKTILDLVSESDGDPIQGNLPRQLCSLRERLVGFTKQVTRYKRMPATHIFVIMISSELRRAKPYALPIQCLPYAGMNEKCIRQVISNVIREMVNHGMSVRGISYMIAILYMFY